MKKHPVDDLFSRKLRDAEVTPREEVYQKLQQRMQSKQRRLGWWQQGPWLAAAGVSLLLVAGWVVWNTNNSKDTLTAQTTSKIEPVTGKNPAQLTKSKPVGEKPTEKQAVLPQQILPEKPQVAIVERVKPIQKSPKLELAMPRSKTQQQQIAQVSETLENDKQKIVPTEEEPKALAQVQAVTSVSEPKSAERTVVLQLPELKQTLVAANEKTISPTSVQSTTPKLDENILNQPKKSTRMAKVWKQLKNAKSGEKVDWDEVGFNPNKLLAKATGKEL